MSEPRSISPRAFIALCRSLREIGATEVNAGTMRARFEALPQRETQLPEKPLTREEIAMWSSGVDIVRNAEEMDD